MILLTIFCFVRHRNGERRSLLFPNYSDLGIQ